MKKQAIVRLCVLAVLLFNQVLVTLGCNPLPFSEDELYEGFTALSTVLMSIFVWWKNNPVTKQAQDAQKVLEKLKEGE